jgi:hypothetical protein
VTQATSEPMRRLGALLGVLVALRLPHRAVRAWRLKRVPKVEADGYPAADKKASRSGNDAASSGHERAKTGREVSSSEPAVNEMRVFSRPRTEEDVLPSRLFYRLKGNHCGEWQRSHDGGCIGEAIADQSRLLLTNVGVRETALYAWPTTNGWVCWAWAEGAGGCIAHFTVEQPRVAFMGIDPDDEGIGYPGTLVGIAADNVASAEVQVRGVRHAATVESNGVFYELIDSSCTMRAFEALIATSRDGSSGTRGIDWSHEATLDGEHPANVLPEGVRADVRLSGRPSAKPA